MHARIIWSNDSDNPVDRDFLFSTPHYKLYEYLYDMVTSDNPVDRDFLFSTMNWDEAVKILAGLVTIPLIGIFCFLPCRTTIGLLT